MPTKVSCSDTERGKADVLVAKSFPNPFCLLKNLTWNGLGLNSASVMRDILRFEEFEEKKFY
jgi:hypothetical protein